MQDTILRPEDTPEGRSQTNEVSDGDVREIDLCEQLAYVCQGADFATLRSVFKTLIGELDADPKRRSRRAINYKAGIQYFTRSEVKTITDGVRDTIYKRLRKLGVSWEKASYAINIMPTTPTHTSAHALSMALCSYPVKMKRAVEVLHKKGVIPDEEASLLIGVHSQYEKVMASIHFNGRFFIRDSKRIKKLIVEINKTRLRKKKSWDEWGNVIFVDE